jgi:hypothetical protein
MFEALKTAREKKRTRKEQDKQARLRLETELKAALEERAAARLKHEERLLNISNCALRNGPCTQSCTHYQEGRISGVYLYWAVASQADVAKGEVASTGTYCSGDIRVDPPFCRLWPEENQPKTIWIDYKRKYK